VELNKMPTYNIKATVEGSRIDTIIAKALQVFGPSTHVEKIEHNLSRAKRLEEAASLVEDAKSSVEELKDEIESWRDNLPENLQDSEKSSALDECVDALDAIYSALEEVDFSSVEFPSMMG
jgi:DNA repair exonuclease SbcCD ATPase subunit